MFVVHYSNNCLIGSSKYLEDVENLKKKYPQLTYFQVEIGIENYVFSIPVTDQKLLEIAKSNCLLIL
jgi:hypothetical protein